MFAERLKELRKERGMTREQVAAGAGMAPSSVGNYERGDSAPDVPGLLKLCASLNVSADYLLGFSDDERPGRVPLDPYDLPLEQQEQIREIADQVTEIGRLDRQHGRELLKVTSAIVTELLAMMKGCDELADRARRDHPVLGAGDPLAMSREERLALLSEIATGSPSDLVAERLRAMGEYQAAIQNRVGEAQREISMQITFGAGEALAKAPDAIRTNKKIPAKNGGDPGNGGQI